MKKLILISLLISSFSSHATQKESLEMRIVRLEAFTNVLKDKSRACDFDLRVEGKNGYRGSNCTTYFSGLNKNLDKLSTDCVEINDDLNAIIKDKNRKMESTQVYLHQLKVKDMCFSEGYTFQEIAKPTLTLEALMTD